MEPKGGEISSGHGAEMRPAVHTEVGIEPGDAVLNHPKANVKQGAQVSIVQVTRQTRNNQYTFEIPGTKKRRTSTESLNAPKRPKMAPFPGTNELPTTTDVVAEGQVCIPEAEAQPTASTPTTPNVNDHTNGEILMQIEGQNLKMQPLSPQITEGTPRGVTEKKPEEVQENGDIEALSMQDCSPSDVAPPIETCMQGAEPESTQLIQLSHDLSTAGNNEYTELSATIDYELYFDGSMMDTTSPVESVLEFGSDTEIAPSQSIEGPSSPEEAGISTSPLPLSPAESDVDIVTFIEAHTNDGSSEVVQPSQIIQSSEGRASLESGEATEVSMPQREAEDPGTIRNPILIPDDTCVTINNNMSQPIVIDDSEGNRRKIKNRQRRSRRQLPDMTNYALTNYEESCNKLLAAWASTLGEWVLLCGLEIFSKNELFKDLKNEMMTACRFVQKHNVWQFERARTLCRRWEELKGEWQSEADEEIFHRFGRALVLFQEEAEIWSIAVGDNSNDGNYVPSRGGQNR